MKKILKYIVITIIALVVIFVASIGILVAFVNPNHFKPMIITAINETTGRQLNLDGNISWTIYPNLGIKIENVALSNPKEFSDSKFLQLNSANIAVELIPLMDHKIIFKALDIDGLNINLLKKGNLNNWTFTPANKETSDKNEAQEKQKTELEFSALSLTNSAIAYTDLDKKTTTALKNINLKLDSGFGGGVKLDTKENELTLHKIKLNYNDQIIGNLDFDVTSLDSPKYIGNLNFDTLKINSLLNQFSHTAKTKMPLLDNITLSANIDGDMNNAKVSKIKFNANNSVKGTMNLNVANLRDPHFNGNINIPNVNLNQVMPQLGMDPIDFANKTMLDNVSFKSNLSGTTKNIDFTNMLLKAADTTVAGSANITSFSPINIIENLNIDHFDVSNISDINGFQVPLNQIHAFGNANLGNNGINTLSGKQTITIANITLIGFDLPRQIHHISDILTTGSSTKTDLLSQAANSAKINQEMNSIKNSINQAVKPGPKDPNLKSNLGSFVLHANFNRGVASPSNFILSGPDLLLNGNGAVSLPAKSLNYTVNGKILTPKTNPLLQHVTIGASISGSFKKPSINLDWNSLINQVLAYAIQNSGAILKQDVNKSISEGINKAIGNAIGNLFHH